MANEYFNILRAGLQAGYDALGTKDANVLYFCTDTLKIYKGDLDFSNHMIVAAAKPATPVAGKMYFLADTSTVEAYVNGAWKVISYPMVTTVDATSDDAHVPSAKAVMDAITAAIADVTGGAAMVKSVEAGSTDGSVKVTTGDNASKEFVVPNVVVSPTWDSATRKLTLPVAGGQSVVVEIGKDIFLDTTAENKYNAETGNIELHLNDGTAIEIPASALVDVYTGGKTDSATVSVDDNNVITCALNIDPMEGNALVLTAAGLKVDLSAYAKTEVVNQQITAVQEVANRADQQATANKNALEILNGDAQTEGSVAKQVATAKTALEQQISGVDQKATTNATNIGTNATNIQANADNIAALAAATTAWGTF